MLSCRCVSLVYAMPCPEPTSCHCSLPQPRAPGQFRFPHFFILGFPKCATTSLYW